MRLKMLCSSLVAGLVAAGCYVQPAPQPYYGSGYQQQQPPPRQAPPVAGEPGPAPMPEPAPLPPPSPPAAPIAPTYAEPVYEDVRVDVGGTLHSTG